jgi:hypothetical protein
VTLGRETPRRAPRGRLKPKHLMTINWADGAPGFSWPNSYFATAVPTEKSVLVAAVDVAANDGYATGR